VDATALYYTFSTIAQTLAGALAVLVAFSLFGLAKLDEAIERGRGSVGGYKDWQKHWKALLADDVEGFEKSVGVRVDDASSRTRMHGAYVAADQRPRILDALRRALAATVADIALCFIALPVTPSLSGAADSHSRRHPQRHQHSKGEVEAPPLLDGFALARVSARRSRWQGLGAGAWRVLPCSRQQSMGQRRNYFKAARKARYAAGRGYLGLEVTTETPKTS